MLDTHLCFISPFMFCLIGRYSRRWSPGAGVPRRRLLRRRVPRRPGVVSEAPRQEASPFRSASLMCFVLAFLRQNLTNYVCTQNYGLYNFVFGSVRPPYLVIYWFILLCLVLCCDIIIVAP